MRILKDNKRLHQTLTCLLVDNNTGRQQVKNINFMVKLNFKKKKSGACVFWAPYFFKFFGGKIKRI